MLLISIWPVTQGRNMNGSMGLEDMVYVTGGRFDGSGGCSLMSRV